MLPLTLGSPGGGPLRILCLGAHSDDIEIGCGGTMMRLLAERSGCTVHWVVFTATAEREREARASAAELLGQASSATVVVKSFRESFLPAAWSEVKEALEEIKKASEPDVVFCHRSDDLHQDHRVIGELAWNTFRDHLVLQYEIAKYEGDLGTPNVFVPLSRAVAERKVGLLLRHFTTQAKRRWFQPDTFHGLMSIRGLECNAAESRAEAFHARKITL